MPYTLSILMVSIFTEYISFSRIILPNLLRPVYFLAFEPTEMNRQIDVYLFNFIDGVTGSSPVQTTTHKGLEALTKRHFRVVFLFML